MKKNKFTPFELSPPPADQKECNGRILRYRKLYNYVGLFGRAYAYLKCPFCGAEVKVYIWSLSGGGKRCICGALHTSCYSIVDKELYNSHILKLKSK